MYWASIAEVHPFKCFLCVCVCMCVCVCVSVFGVVKTPFLVNHGFDTRHFRHFRRFLGCEDQKPCFVCRMQTRHFRPFRQNPLFSVGTKPPFPKTTVFTTLMYVCVCVCISSSHALSERGEGSIPPSLHIKDVQNPQH